MGTVTDTNSLLEGAVEALELEVVRLRDLRPHPRNYKYHPDDQLQHLVESIRQFGVYRNVVVAQDGTILAGHGVVQAAIRAGLESGPVRRMPFGPDDPRALKLIALDNEVTHLSENDDRVLSELLKEVKDTSPGGLFGTGYDEAMLAALAMVTRPASEIADVDAAAEWAGADMPEYDGEGIDKYKLVVTFRSREDQERFVQESGIRIDKREAKVWSTRWPFTERVDLASVRFSSGGG